MTRPMKIWIVNNHAVPPQLGGLVRHYYFSHYLQEWGHSVRILTDSMVHNTEKNFTARGQLIREVDFDDVTFTFVRGMDYHKNDYRRILNGIQFNRNLTRAMDQLYSAGERPDVIYASSPTPFSGQKAMKFARKHGIPFVFEERDLWPLSLVQYGNLEKKILAKPILAHLYRLEHRLHGNAQASIFTISGGKDYIRDMGWDDIPQDRIHYINNGVDLEEYRDNLAHVHYEDEDLDDPSTYKVVYTGSIRRIYEIDRILDLAFAIREELPQVRFLFYGEGPERPRLEEKARAMGITNVLFKGRVQKKEIPSILSRADLTLKHHKKVGLNQYGSSNNKVFEYLASGRPIFSTVWNNHSVIRSYDVGIECPDQEVETMVEGLKEVLSWDDDRLSEMKQRAIKAAEDFDFESLSHRLEKILFEVIEQ